MGHLNRQIILSTLGRYRFTNLDTGYDLWKLCYYPGAGRFVVTRRNEYCPRDLFFGFNRCGIQIKQDGLIAGSIGCHFSAYL